MSEHDSGTGTTIRRGDADGLATFIEQHRGQLTAFLQKRTGSHLRIKIEPEDIFQEVVADALRAVAQDDWEPCEPLHWLYALCERRIIDAHRHYFAAQKRSAAREAKLSSGIALEDLLVASMTTPSAAFFTESEGIGHARSHRYAPARTAGSAADALPQGHAVKGDCFTTWQDRRRCPRNAFAGNRTLADVARCALTMDHKTKGRAT